MIWNRILWEGRAVSVGVCACSYGGVTLLYGTVCACAYTSTCMGRPLSASDALTQELTALFLRQTLLLNLKFKIQLGWLASKHQRSKILASQGWDD